MGDIPPTITHSDTGQQCHSSSASVGRSKLEDPIDNEVLKTALELTPLRCMLEDSHGNHLSDLSPAFSPTNNIRNSTKSSFCSYNPASCISHRGSCFNGTSTKSSDEWQTCLEAWQALEPIFRFLRTARKRIWQPFYYDGQCKRHLVHGLGFDESLIHHSPGEDFFQMAKDTLFLSQVDVIWDNPPYTSPQTKRKVLETLKATNKPFCMLLPVAILQSAFCREFLDMDSVQCVYPRRVMVKKKFSGPVPFKLLVWFCYKMKLPKDIYFVD